MICSSLNRDNLIVRLLPVDGLYSNLEEIWGLRSPAILALDKSLHPDSPRRSEITLPNQRSTQAGTISELKYALQKQTRCCFIRARQSSIVVNIVLQDRREIRPGCEITNGQRPDKAG
jgi:hypothetical protein